MRTQQMMEFLREVDLVPFFHYDMVLVHTKQDKFVGLVNTKKFGVMNTDSIHTHTLTQKQRDTMFVVLVEYSSTPVPERAEPKYIYRFYVPIATNHPVPLYVRRYRHPEGCGVILDASSFEYVKTAPNFHFTEEEVKEFPTEIQFLFALCTKEAVVHEDGGHQKLLD